MHGLYLCDIFVMFEVVSVYSWMHQKYLGCLTFTEIEGTHLCIRLPFTLNTFYVATFNLYTCADIKRLCLQPSMCICIYCLCYSLWIHWKYMKVLLIFIQGGLCEDTNLAFTVFVFGMSVSSLNKSWDVFIVFMLMCAALLTSPLSPSVGTFLPGTIYPGLRISRALYTQRLCNHEGVNKRFLSTVSCFFFSRLSVETGGLIVLFGSGWRY